VGEEGRCTRTAKGTVLLARCRRMEREFSRATRKRPAEIVISETGKKSGCRFAARPPLSQTVDQ